ncbi:nuclear prelamin A recognition factor [Clarias gariepinus]|uniref:nuclear prelamin A recognition factor n=1 Tax=Clarias gariepinus TaxID=13013 RepID=UPI00234DF582|nr:nuclear prelamin A recognition factor [Clarias gariepinus]
MSEVIITKRKEKCENCTKQCKKKLTDEAVNLELDGDVANGEVSSQPVLLSACLSCDGCVSEEENQKISQQSLQEINRVLALNKKCDSSKHKVLVVSVCPQSLPFFAVKFHMGVPAAAQKLCGFLKSVGVKYVFDTTLAASFSILESQREFVQRYRRRHSDAHAMPMFTSSCPGWIRYAEHVLGSLVTPHICTARSPQQVMGSLVKDYFTRKQKLSQEQVYHVVVAPCFDKKLEAVREEFHKSLLHTRDVDCVLTSMEILHMMERSNVSVEDIEPVPLDHVFADVTDTRLMRHEGRGSEGFLEHILKYAAKELFGLDVKEVVYKTLRNRDFQEVVLERDGETLLQCAAVYGFRNIQTLVHRMRKGKVPYQLVEVLSCPGGCLSGRGQAEGEGGKPDRSLVQQLEEAYGSLSVRLPEANPEVQRLYEDWLEGQDSPLVQQILHTHYNADTESPSNTLGPDMQW